MFVKLWDLQHRPFPHGLIKTVVWQLLFVTFSQICWFSELWDSAPSPSCEVALLSPRFNLPCCPFFQLPAFPVVCRPHISLPNDCSVSYLHIYHLLLLCTGFSAWPVNSSCCSTQVCPQNSQIGSCFGPCLSSNLGFHLRLNIFFLHILQEVSFLALIYSVLLFWVLYLFLWN